MWHKKAIEIDLNKFYVVYHPTKDSVWWMYIMGGQLPYRI